MLPQDVRSDVVCGANDEQGEDVRVSIIEMIEIDQGISHYSWVLSLIGSEKTGNRAVICAENGHGKAEGAGRVEWLLASRLAMSGLGVINLC